ncbi:ribosomal protein L28e [Pseudovirgaria hyperparasitica]|uniref:Ribosomal protein L28e n=1 Tax=Pseudovirgaria hyperparasitica TaxID=470096 RepID=A0A6A6W1G2_9PEZI|nr:ribosomal protein L28e [Pseudovirgaria hyperparasitica]KAF2755824.1 ribosomal protein L28e [Pseudovirgaria hyperparasitica]
MASNLSEDILWFISRGNHATLVKRKTAGGIQFSRDPLNLTNLHAKKYEGYANDRAIGIQPNPDGGLTLLTKKPNKANKPGLEINAASYGAGKSSRRTYKSIVNSTAKKGYRADLRTEAVARASAIRQLQRKKKDAKPAKLRGGKAAKAAA